MRLRPSQLSILTFPSFTTSAHFAISVLMKFWNSVQA